MAKWAKCATGYDTIQ